MVDYFNKISDANGYGTTSLLSDESITTDDIDKAFNTADYFPDKKTRYKTGKGSYGGNSKEATKNYGKNLYATMRTSQRLFVNALNYKIQDLENQLAKTNKSESKKIDEINKELSRDQKILKEVQSIVFPTNPPKKDKKHKDSTKGN